MIIGIPVYRNRPARCQGAPRGFKWMTPSVDVKLIAETPGKITTRDGFTFLAPHSFADTSGKPHGAAPAGYVASFIAVRQA
jgi:hypothetical protein